MTYQAPFSDFVEPIRPATQLRQAITAAYRRDETECLGPLLAAARVDRTTRAAIRDTATHLVTLKRPGFPGGSHL